MRFAGRLAAGGRGCWWHGGVLEGGVAAAMVAGTGALAGLPLDGPLLVLAFCGTLLVYHLDRTPVLSPEDRFNHPARWRWRRAHGGQAAALAGTAMLGACWALPQLRGRTLGAGFFLAVPAVAYALPVLANVSGGGSGDRRRLKDVGPAKPFVVAAAWALGSVGLPALEAGASLTASAGTLALLACYRFLFVLPNLLLADAADRDGDARTGLRTVATMYPSQCLRRGAIGALAACVAGGALALLWAETPRLLLAVDLAGPLLLLPVLLATRAPHCRRARLADLTMLGPALTALVAAACAWMG
jgi:4-hydroxybenzoate polyprenyltransferase